MEGGGAHLGSSLPVSVFHRRQSFSCAGGRLRSRAPFSFAGAVFVRVRRFRSRGVALVRGPSPWFVGGHLWRRFRSRASFSFAGGRLGSWAVVFARVRGPSPSFVGGQLCPWAVAFVHGGSCSLVGDRLHSWAVMPFVWCVGNWWGVVASRWCVVVVGPRGRSWWSSRVVASLLWLRRGSRWCV